MGDFRNIYIADFTVRTSTQRVVRQREPAGTTTTLARALQLEVDECTPYGSLYHKQYVLCLGGSQNFEWVVCSSQEEKKKHKNFQHNLEGILLGHLLSATLPRPVRTIPVIVPCQEFAYRLPS